MSDVHEHAGGCGCGRVRYRALGPPIVVHACHCRRCQALSGTAFAVNAMLEADRVALDRGVLVEADTRDGHRRSSCADCGVAVWTRHPALGDPIRLLAVGTLDDPAVMPPDVHCFTATRLPWVPVPDAVPAFDGDYDPTDVWTAEAQGRIADALS